MIKERVSTGIPGLDESTNGGFEKDSAIMVSGGGGSGKTIFGVQFLMEGITQNNETGVYISFEENKEKFIKHMTQFGWDLEKLVKQGRFVFIQYEPERIASLVEAGGERLKKSIQDINAKRIVIDSLSAFLVLFEKESEQRRMLVKLFDMIASWGCTVVVVGEEDHYLGQPRSSILGFMADAIILLYTCPVSSDPGSMIRAMQISKMRGSKHNFHLFPYKITDKGFIAYPRESIRGIKGIS
ncbi:MAG: ATPase domain-containing protein [Nanoarchaeota archaeon]